MEYALENGTVVSSADMEKIFRIVDRDYHKQDVICKIEEEYGEEAAEKAAANDALVEEIAERFEHDLGNNEIYFEAMWDTMSMVLEEYFEHE